MSDQTEAWQHIGSSKDAINSPFDADSGRQFAWDTVSLNWLEDCPRKYKYFMLEGWRPKGDNVNIRFGGLYARALQIYHLSRVEAISHETALFFSVKETLLNSWPWNFDDTIKTRENLIRSIIWYLEQFKDDPCQTVILSNGEPAVELQARVQLDEHNVLVGHLDRLVEFAGRSYIQDQKTTKSSVGGFYFDRFSPDVQMSQYSFIGRIAFRESLEGIMLDVAQIQVGGTQYKRGFTYRTKEQLEEWIEAVRWWVGPYRDAAEAAGWPMNHTSCGKFGDVHGTKDGGCPLRKVCRADPRVREQVLESDFEKHPWNPLAERK
jgi:hypothetical protein